MSAPHPWIVAFLDSLHAAGRATTAASYGSVLARFQTWAEAHGIDIATASTEQVAAYQRWLAETPSERTGRMRAKTTQATGIIVVQSWYGWLVRRGHLLRDPTARLIVPSVPDQRTVRKDHLNLQEVTALIQTQAQRVTAQAGPRDRARESRNLAIISLAVATGRRVQGVVDLQVSDLDRQRMELRVEREKGHVGRVLPVAAWAMAHIGRYLDEDRPWFAHGSDSPWLFVSQRGAALTTRAIGFIIDEAVLATIAANPDLRDLPRKRISTHSLRVSFATMLFHGGCNIRSINELLLHRNLSTTAAYTPLTTADRRRAILHAHPRA
jgi:integrase/recombinase XerD